MLLNKENKFIKLINKIMCKYKLLILIHFSFIKIQ